MKRKVIQIDEERCTGCGLCVSACHEGAIGLVNGKARLLRDDYCDGLGDCLPACPTDAISFVEREAAPYNEAAVLAAKAAQKSEVANDGESLAAHPAGGCPGSLSRLIEHMASTPSSDVSHETSEESRNKQERSKARLDNHASSTATSASASASTPISTPDVSRETSGDSRSEAAENEDGRAAMPSELRQWPAQIKLVPLRAPYFEGADLLVAADCTAFSYGDFHARFMRGHTTLIGCPKLDAVDYTDKLTAILAENDVKSVTVARMEVPCCGGLENAARRAIESSGKNIPLQVTTISVDGNILN